VESTPSHGVNTGVDCLDTPTRKKCLRRETGLPHGAELGRTIGSKTSTREYCRNNESFQYPIHHIPPKKYVVRCEIALRSAHSVLVPNREYFVETPPSHDVNTGVDCLDTLTRETGLPHGAELGRTIGSKTSTRNILQLKSWPSLNIS